MLLVVVKNVMCISDLSALPVNTLYVHFFQGKGLFAKRPFKKGETIFTEHPLVSAQFLWNALYKYKGEQCCCLVFKHMPQKVLYMHTNIHL